MPVRFAVIGGSGVYDLDVLEGADVRSMTTPYGSPSSPLKVGRVGRTEVAFLARHGIGHAIPPHRINHRANLWALKELGVRRILGTSSVGSLKREIRPGTFAVPHDFLSLWDLPTFHDDKVVHATPTLDEGMRKAIVATAKRKGARVRARAVYAQTRGPRLETKAEIRLLRDYADVVGMTMASEATLAAEVGLAYASLCAVDNFAHGIAPEPLTYEAIAAKQRENAKRVTALAGPLIEALAVNGGRI
ncbi:MAG TPA: MTAP family purine nucleoside phosphorylase [Thermoplasmata archaeon]|nr:MTAP family purine nucleoside phosphorylase [Thermoplasmata archaeon]